jgi:hypothetical protein
MAFSTGITVGYVDYSGGDDANDGTISLPWKTIQTALDNMTVGAEGSLILLQPGTHVIESTLDFSGLALTADKTLMIRGDGERVTLDGNGSTRIATGEDYVSWGNAIFENQGISGYITLGDFSVMNNCKIVKDSLLGQAAVIVTGTNVQIHECDLIIDSNANYAIQVTGADVRINKCFIASTENASQMNYFVLLGGGAQLIDSVLYNGQAGPTLAGVFCGNYAVCDGNTLLAGAGASVPGFVLAGRSLRMAIVNNVVQGYDRVVKVDTGFGMVGAVVAGNLGASLGTGFWENEVDDFSIKEDNETVAGSVLRQIGDPEDPDDRATYYMPIQTGNIYRSTWNGRKKGAIGAPTGSTTATPVQIGII